MAGVPFRAREKSGGLEARRRGNLALSPQALRLFARSKRKRFLDSGVLNAHDKGGKDRSIIRTLHLLKVSWMSQHTNLVSLQLWRVAFDACVFIVTVLAVLFQCIRAPTRIQMFFPPSTSNIVLQNLEMKRPTLTSPSVRLQWNASPCEN